MYIAIERLYSIPFSYDSKEVIFMANCKICGESVSCTPVFHSECLEKLIDSVSEDFCDNYCQFPKAAPDEESLHTLHCKNCPLIQFHKLTNT